jgi:uncharacterized protein (TIGR02145 family)
MKLTKLRLLIFLSLAFFSPLPANAQKPAFYYPDDGNIFWCIDISQIPFNNEPIRSKLPGIQICNQVWMDKNLNVAKYRNGDPIPKVTDTAKWKKLTTGAYCYFNNDSARYAAIYGKLYNWYAVNDPRGLAPKGWHIPGIAEWISLETCLTDTSLTSTSGVGAALKETGTQYWASPNTGATNRSNFKGLPGGFRDYNGTFYFLGKFGYLWTSTEYYKKYAWGRTLNYFDMLIGRDGYKKQDGFSVRCLRD